MYVDVLRSLDTKTNPVTANLQDRDFDLIGDNNLLVFLSADDEHGESIVLSDGRTITPEMVLGPERHGKSVVYCLDTQFTERSIELADRCTALIHETTFGPDAADMARDRKHSTMEDAARVAKEAACDNLIATHFSSRYDGRQVKKIADDARGLFENITLGKDLLEIEV